MRTAGVDLSSWDEKSAACVVEWLPGRADITSLAPGVDDAEAAIDNLLVAAALVRRHLPELGDGSEQLGARAW